MISKQIKPGLWCIGKREEGLRAFGAASFTEGGMMYNTYLMDTGGGYLLLGAPPARYAAAWLAEVKRIAGGGVNWAVLFGTDNDRPAAKLLLGEYPEVTLIGGGVLGLEAASELMRSGIQVTVLEATPPDHRTAGGRGFRRHFAECHGSPGGCLP